MNTSPSTRQSNFVTILAWVLIIFNALGVLGALMQNIIVNFVFPKVMATAPPGMPAEQFPLTFFRTLAFLVLLFEVFVLYAAYALLQRRNWARRTFVVLFALGIAWNVLALVGFGLGLGFADLFGVAAQEMPVDPRTVFTTIFIGMAVFAILMTVLFVWLIRRLRSPEIKAEFSSGVPALA
jgi:hypothetical protein